MTRVHLHDQRHHAAVRAVDFTIQAPPPPPTSTPTVIVNPTTVAAGSSVTVGGTGFNGASSATVSLGTLGSQAVTIGNDGGFSGATFTIPFNQAAGQISGTVTPNGGVAAQPFSVTVTNDTSVDGPVPGSGGTGSGTTTTGTGSGTTTGTGTGSGTGSGTTPAYATGSTKPRLPNTGTDTVWPGVVGGLLVLSGAGLLWVGRRRADGAVTAA